MDSSTRRDELIARVRSLHARLARGRRTIERERARAGFVDNPRMQRYLRLYIELQEEYDAACRELAVLEGTAPST